MQESPEATQHHTDHENLESKNEVQSETNESNHSQTRERSELVHLGQEMPLLRGEKAVITSLPVPQPYDFKGLARGMAERPETKILSVLELDPQEIAPALGMMVINETGQVIPVSFLPKGRATLHYQRNNLDRPGELEWHQFDLIPEYMGDTRVEEFNKSPNMENAWIEVKGQSGDSYKIGFTHVFRGRESSVTGVRYKMEKMEGRENEKDKKPEERGEVRIKSGIKGVTWSLASSSGDTADYDTDEKNLIYANAPETSTIETTPKEEKAKSGDFYVRASDDTNYWGEPVVVGRGKDDVSIIGAENRDVDEHVLMMRLNPRTFRLDIDNVSTTNRVTIALNIPEDADEELPRFTRRSKDGKSVVIRLDPKSGIHRLSREQSKYMNEHLAESEGMEITITSAETTVRRGKPGEKPIRETKEFKIVSEPKDWVLTAGGKKIAALGFRQI